MIVINKTDKPRYSNIAHKMLSTGQRSADCDSTGLCKALEYLLANTRGCVIKLNAHERTMLEQVIAMDDEGRTAKIEKPKVVDPIAEMLKKDGEEKRKLVDDIVSSREKQEAIMAETTYTSRRDMDAARNAADNIAGEVKAKKLASTGAKPVSLSDLMGDNKFIEESMKHSKIATTVASEDGWDMEKMKESSRTSHVEETAAVSGSVSDVEKEAVAASESKEVSVKSSDAVSDQKKPRTRKGRKVNG